MTGFVGIPISSERVADIACLLLHHADPFDRLLVAQALAMLAHLVTADAELTVYFELNEWVERDK